MSGGAALWGALLASAALAQVPAPRAPSRPPSVAAAAAVRPPEPEPLGDEPRPVVTAVELQVPRDEVKNWIYRLVGLGVFTGYINWDDGVLYSAQASKLRELTNCKKCGGEVKLVGKGVVKCPYCGTEYFLD